MTFHILKIGLCSIACFTFSLTASAQHKKKPSAEKLFARMDKNTDNTISLEEFKSIKRKKDVSNKVLEKRFKRMDEDKNNAITIEELKAHLKKQREKRAKKEAK